MKSIQTVFSPKGKVAATISTSKSPDDKYSSNRRSGKHRRHSGVLRSVSQMVPHFFMHQGSGDCLAPTDIHGTLTDRAIRELSMRLETEAIQAKSKNHQEKISVEMTFYRKCFGVYESGEWQVCDNGLIHPKSYFASIWNIMMFLFIILCCVYIPFEIAFEYETSFTHPDPGRRAWHAIILVMDFYFWLDLGVEFLLSVYVEGELLKTKTEVMKHYLVGWFVPDALAGIGSLLGRFGGSGVASLMRNIRILRLVRLLKLFRLAKLKQIMDALEDTGPELMVLAKLAKLLMLTITVTHFCGCLFIMIARGRGNQNNWMSDYLPECTFEIVAPFDINTDDSNRYHLHNSCVSMLDQYVLGIYWAFITVTTVGYGDINPNPYSLSERTFTILTSFVGTGIFAYINGQITVLATHSSAQEYAFARKKDAVMSFSEYRLSNNLYAEN